jgi:hypothetical protein
MWKDIDGYEGLYQVSNTGEVISLNYKRCGCVSKLKLNKDTVGYLQVKLYKNKKKKNFKVHRLVAQAFLPNPLNLPEINHKDEDKTNNLVFLNEDGSVDKEKSNLEWCDRDYNIHYGTGQKRGGEKRVNGKKSKPVLQFSKDGDFIREYPSTMEVQRQLGFSQGFVSACCRGKYKQAYGFIWRYKEKGEE